MSTFARASRTSGDRRDSGAGPRSAGPLQRMFDGSPRVAAQAEMAETLNGGGAVVQRLDVLNIGSGTDPRNFIGEETVKREESKGKDVTLNVDSGHMLLAQLLSSLGPQFFVLLEKREELDIKWAPLGVRAGILKSNRDKVPEDLPDKLRSTEAYRDFVMRAWFEKHPGRAGFGEMLDLLAEVEPGLVKAFLQGIEKLESGGNFKRGFAENLSETVGKKQFDEVHVISALGFDLINDQEAAAEVASTVKPGGKLIITAEQSGMVSKAMKMKRVKESSWPVPVVENGKPQIKDGLTVSRYFRYDPDASSFGDYEDVFESQYEGISTSHTTGGGFGKEIPFARLVFIRKRTEMDVQLARRDYETAQWIAPEEFGGKSFAEFLEDYYQS